jgi:hypothetical protein
MFFYIKRVPIFSYQLDPYPIYQFSIMSLHTNLKIVYQIVCVRDHDIIWYGGSIMYLKNFKFLLAMNCFFLNVFGSF